MARGKEVKRERTLDDEEIKALWNADLGHPFGPFIRLLFVTGQRRAEVAEMRWRDLNLEARLWTLQPEMTKPGRKHEVPLSPLALEVIEALPRFTGPYVFSTTGGERPISGFSKAKRRADKATGLREWRFHDCRRTCATGLGRLGVPTGTISWVLGHAPRGVTEAVYERASHLKEKRHALDRWAQKLSNILAPPPEKVVPLRRG